MNESIPSTQADDPMVPVPIPMQVPAKEGMAELPGTHLGYWDTGGTGEPVVFLHPASGSALVWLYQQPVFARAGYRVVAYSRRNYYNSDLAPEDNPGTGSEDLHHLIEFLGLEKFHAVSSAAGGSVAADYAVSHPERLLSLTVSSNNLAAATGDIAETAAKIRLKEWDDLPRWFRELGPSYRAANPEGVEKWIELNHKSETGKGARQKLANVVTPEKLRTLKVRTLLITGAADMFTPPSVMRMIARHVPNNEGVIVAECGHSPYWEQPEFFNRAVLGFLGRPSKSTRDG
ncbi:MAG: alpha/beta hydrolase [Deltaproteobacteria bacterium]|nr:alpha/beta hydrolase [Deltaproteobacteria bacterium]MDP2607215.1 alpha/beta hydrolase [Deltaproteobacteria bacterium]MDZ4343926.1 alpha/beta hydrolase [Candidatus Binatia bacterium]